MAGCGQQHKHACICLPVLTRAYRSCSPAAGLPRVCDPLQVSEVRQSPCCGGGHLWQRVWRTAPGMLEPPLALQLV